MGFIPGKRGVFMKRRAVALVAHENANLRRQVQAALQGQNVEAVYARDCRDVRAALDCRRAPDVILIGTSFANGNWRDVVTLARAARPPVDVVLAIDEAAFPDSEGETLHLESMDQGAFDFLVLPFGANVAQVLADRFADPRVLHPALWRKPNQNFPRLRSSVSARSRYNPFSILEKGWRRGPARRESKDRLRTVTRSY
jgi:DNA-binding NtrC family response regulator